MSHVDNPYRSWGLIADQAPVSERADFIRKTYLHLAAAILAFVAIEAVLLQMPGLDQLLASLFSSRWGWLVVLAGFMGVSHLANAWASSSTSVGTQYLGLGLYVVAEAVIFVPLLYMAEKFGGADLIPTAGMLTLLIFAGLTAIVYFSGADFSFMRGALTIAGFVALGLILCSAIFGFQLGIVFVAAMIGLASGYILYDTSNVLHHYRIGQHVAAALALFASVALLFWYIVQLLMSLSSRD
jgi:FtsH-binding integral membrane protein